MYELGSPVHAYTPTASANSVLRGIGPRMYIDNVTLTLHNVTLTPQKPCQPALTSVIAAKQTVINEAYVISI